MLPDRVFGSYKYIFAPSASHVKRTPEQIHLRHTSLEKMAIRLTSMLEMAEVRTTTHHDDQFS